MPNPQLHTVEVTCDPSGDANVDSFILNGLIAAIRYEKNDFADGVDFTITGKDTGQGIWTESDVNAGVMKYPRTPVHGVADGAALSGGYSPILLLNEAVNIVVASGGNGTTGKFHILMVDP